MNESGGGFLVLHSFTREGMLGVEGLENFDVEDEFRRGDQMPVDDEGESVNNQPGFINADRELFTVTIDFDGVPVTEEFAGQAMGSAALVLGGRGIVGDTPTVTLVSENTLDTVLARPVLLPYATTSGTTLVSTDMTKALYLFVAALSPTSRVRLGLLQGKTYLNSCAML